MDINLKAKEICKNLSSKGKYKTTLSSEIQKLKTTYGKNFSSKLARSLLNVVKVSVDADVKRKKQNSPHAHLPMATVPKRHSPSGSSDNDYCSSSQTSLHAAGNASPTKMMNVAHTLCVVATPLNQRNSGLHSKSDMESSDSESSDSEYETQRDPEFHKRPSTR